MNIFEFAMQMEKDGKEYYEKLASETGSVGLKTIFTNLAADETKHYTTFKELRDGLKGSFAESKTLETGKNLFKELIADQKNAELLAASLDGYRHGMENEEASVKFYEDSAKKESDPELVKLLLRIASEERDHYRILENLYQYTLAPKNFLEWREFGNLKPL
jgi:rubrerythrin